MAKISSDITKIPLEAHQRYAERMSRPHDATIVRTQEAANGVLEGVLPPFDPELGHYMSVGQPLTLAMFPGKPPLEKSRDAWELDGTLFREQLVRTWKGIKERYPRVRRPSSLRAGFTALQGWKRLCKRVWEERHGMFGE